MLVPVLVLEKAIGSGFDFAGRWQPEEAESEGRERTKSGRIIPTALRGRARVFNKGGSFLGVNPPGLNQSASGNAPNPQRYEHCG